MSLFRGLLHDAALLRPGAAPVAAVVEEHQGRRAAGPGDLIGPLVVPDTALVQVGRAALDEPVEVSVVNSGGAGGLTALAGRSVPGVRVVAVESSLRDLDDLAGNAARVTAAARELDPEVAVYVGLPYAPGWVRAVEEVEAAGLLGKIRIADPAQLAEQMAVLVEADLAFKTGAGPDDNWPRTGLLTLLMALDALIDDAGEAEATDLLRLGDRNRIAEAVDSWDDGSRQRIRRRLRGVDCFDVAVPVEELLALGVLGTPQ